MAVAKRVTASGGARENSFYGLGLEPKWFGCPVRSRGARPMASCHGSSSKAARAPVERFLTTAKMPPEATGKHASHPNGVRSRPWLGSAATGRRGAPLGASAAAREPHAGRRAI